MSVLQCSALSNSQNRTCSTQYSFYWFRVGTDKYTSVIYTIGEEHNECESQSCVYHFTKNINYHDMGTYYSTVAICGEILFGKGTKVDVEGTNVL